MRGNMSNTCSSGRTDVLWRSSSETARSCRSDRALRTRFLRPTRCCVLPAGNIGAIALARAALPYNPARTPVRARVNLAPAHAFTAARHAWSTALRAPAERSVRKPRRGVKRRVETACSRARTPHAQTAAHAQNVERSLNARSNIGAAEAIAAGSSSRRHVKRTLTAEPTRRLEPHRADRLSAMHPNLRHERDGHERRLLGHERRPLFVGPC